MKKRLLILLALLLYCLPSFADVDPRQEYAEKYAALAIKEMKRSGVPASITLAQGILESRYGQSVLAVKGNNHFGIKCHNDWRGRKMYMDDDARNDCFRVYPRVEDSFRDHSDFLRSKDRYKFLFELKQTDYKGWARGLKKAGYATDPQYAAKLINLIEEYALYRYDRRGQAKKETPLELETPEVIEIPVKEAAPEIVYDETVAFTSTKKVYRQNGVPFVYANAGETTAKLARRHEMFAGELLRYNELDAPVTYLGGEIVYLARKKTKGPKGVDKYVVGEDGESLYEISQRFGVRLSSLKKMNPALSGMELLDEGDTVVLR